MHTFGVKPTDLLLAHIYFVLLVQLLFNWSTYDCGYRTNLWALAIYIIFFLRLVIAQLLRLAHHDQKANLQEEKKDEKRQALSAEYQQAQPFISTEKRKLPVSPVVARIFKHTTQLLLLAICIYLIVEMSKHPDQFERPQCQSRAILIVNIAGTFLACIISVVDVVLSCRTTA